MKQNVSLNRCQKTLLRRSFVCLRPASQSPSIYFRLLTVQTRGMLRLADSSECFRWETALHVVHHHIPVRNMPPPDPTPSRANSTRELPIKYFYKYRNRIRTRVKLGRAATSLVYFLANPYSCRVGAARTCPSIPYFPSSVQRGM